MMDMVTVPGGDAVAAAGWVLLGYAAVLVTPGPNALAIAAVAAVRGFAGTVPLCLGVACGVGVVAAACLAAASALPAPGPWADDLGRIVCAALLLCLAFRVLGGAAPGGGGARLAGFGTGLCAAVSNPVTAAFFLSQFAGPLGAPSGRAGGVLAVAGVAAMALGYGLVLADSWRGGRLGRRRGHGTVRSVSAARRRWLRWPSWPCGP